MQVRGNSFSFMSLSCSCVRSAPDLVPTGPEHVTGDVAGLQHLEGSSALLLQLSKSDA